MSSAADTTWEFLNSLAPLREHKASTDLFKQGTQAEYVQLIVDGLVKLTRLSRTGRELIIGLRPPLRLLGAASVILQKPHPVTARTLTSCRIRSIPAEIFVSLAKSDIHFSWSIQREQCREIHELVALLVQLGCFSARQRLEQLLYQFISVLNPDNSSEVMNLQLPLKLWEVAELVAITPEHLSRVLHTMQQEGVLRREKNSIVILASQKLLPPST